MKIKSIATILAFMAIIVFSTSANACTIFNASKDGISLVGNNEDSFDNSSKVWFVPASQGKYGKVCFGFESMYSQGGMNDQGLFFDWFASDPYKPCPVVSGQMLPGDIVLKDVPSIEEHVENFRLYGSTNDKMLDSCATVDEALDFYKKYYEPGFGYAKMMIVDRNLNSVIISWDWAKGELAIDRKKGNYQIVGTGYPKLLPLFIDGEYNISVNGFASLLEKAQQTVTQYSNIYDLQKGDVYVYIHHNYKKLIKFNLETEVKKGYHIYDLQQLFNKKQILDMLKTILPILLLVILTVYAALSIYRKNRKKNKSGELQH